MKESNQTVWTVGRIAQSAGVPVHRVSYLVRAHSIKPAYEVGNYRIFTPQDALNIIDELKRKSEAQKGGLN